MFRFGRSHGKTMSFAFIISTLLSIQALHGGVVNFSGYLTIDRLGVFGGPVAGGLVVLGAFAPDFDESLYSCTYGDGDCNLDYGSAFTDAVADGNFIPIANTLSGPDGTFSGSGFTSLPEGTELSIFAFESSTPDSFFQAIFGGVDTSWFVSNAGNRILVGEVRLSVVPFPEPTGFALLGVAFLASLSVRRWR